MSLADSLRENPDRLTSIIDHTNVDPTATEAEIRELCRAVLEYGFCSAVVVPYHANLAHDIAAVKDAIGDTTLKCIIESPALSRPEIEQAAALAEEGGADLVKTAVGYDGPTDHAEVEAIRNGISSDTGIKASGGISSFDEVLEMVTAGATRIGASSGVEIYSPTNSTPVISNRAPPAGLSVALIVHPCASTSCSTILSPKPVPSALVE